MKKEKATDGEKKTRVRKTNKKEEEDLQPCWFKTIKWADYKCQEEEEEVERKGGRKTSDNNNNTRVGQQGQAGAKGRQRI